MAEKLQEVASSSRPKKEIGSKDEIANNGSSDNTATNGIPDDQANNGSPDASANNGSNDDPPIVSHAEDDAETSANSELDDN